MKRYFAAVLACAALLMLTGCGRWGIFSNEIDRWLSESNPSLEGRSDSEDFGEYEEHDDDSEDESDSGETYTAELGETMHTCFFDFTVESVEPMQSYDGKTADDDMIFLDAYITITNTYGSELPMSIYDFQIQWGDFTEEEYGYEAEPFWDDESAMPEHYTLDNGDTTSLHVIYQVPADSIESPYVLCYLEEFSDGSQGDLFGVVFQLNDATSSATVQGAAQA